MSANWLRYFDLQLSAADGEVISLSDFKVTFQIDCPQTAGWRVATIRIFNLGSDTQNKILNRKYNRVQVLAGYQGVGASANSEDQGLIFSGELRFSFAGRDKASPTETFTLIQACDGHKAMMNAMVNETQGAGYSAEHLNTLMMRSFVAQGLSQGLLPALPATVFPRGKVFYGMTHEYMNDFAAQCKANWQIVHGKVTLVPEDNYVYEPIVLNSETGLVGMPEQTMDNGINVRCLINPRIQPNSLIHIDESAILKKEYQAQEIRKADGYLTPVNIATDGVYLVTSIKYSGNTRGTEWYMDMICLAREEKEKMQKK
nr:hypothetical protein [uncultured Enterobacter sp.]